MDVLTAVTLTGTGPWIVGAGTLVGLAALGYLLWRGGTGQALGYMREANEVLNAKLEEYEAERRILREQIALLETRTSLEPMVAAVVNQFEAHERRARERHDALMRHNDAMLNLIELLAQRLGPEGE